MPRGKALPVLPGYMGLSDAYKASGVSPAIIERFHQQGKIQLFEKDSRLYCSSANIAELKAIKASGEIKRGRQKKDPSDNSVSVKGMKKSESKSKPGKRGRQKKETLNRGLEAVSFSSKTTSGKKQTVKLFYDTEIENKIQAYAKTIGILIPTYYMPGLKKMYRAAKLIAIDYSKCIEKEKLKAFVDSMKTHHPFAVAFYHLSRMESQQYTIPIATAAILNAGTFEIYRDSLLENLKEGRLTDFAYLDVMGDLVVKHSGTRGLPEMIQKFSIDELTSDKFAQAGTGETKASETTSTPGYDYEDDEEDSDLKRLLDNEEGD